MSFLISFRAKVVKVERKHRALRAFKTGKINPDGSAEIKIEYEDIGWFVHLDGSWESLFVGMEKPDLAEGHIMHVTMRSEGEPTQPKAPELEPEYKHNERDRFTDKPKQTD